MKINLLLKIFTVLFVLLAGLLVLSYHPKEAQALTYTCNITTINFNGTNHPPSVNVPTNTNFNLNVSCQATFPSPRDLSVTWQGVTYTKTGLTGVISVPFGPWNSPIDAGANATFSAPGDTITCNTTCNIQVNNGIIATPLPLPNCLTSYTYNPSIPVPGQSFQIQFNNLSNTNISNGISRYRVRYAEKDGISGEITPTDASSTYGMWFVQFDNVKGEFSWKVLFDGNPCGTQDTIFPGASGGNGLAGRNPCQGSSCQTAIGPVCFGLKCLSEKLLSIAIGIAGALALILMVRGAISILMSQGDPQKVNNGREIIIAAVAGLLFLIFSVLILNFIGIKIFFGIPGIA